VVQNPLHDLALGDGERAAFNVLEKVKCRISTSSDSHSNAASDSPFCQPELFDVQTIFSERSMSSIERTFLTFYWPPWRDIALQQIQTLLGLELSEIRVAVPVVPCYRRLLDFDGATRGALKPDIDSECKSG
jgi:hypothetical protein